MQQPQRFAPQSLPPGHMARFAQPAFSVLFMTGLLTILSKSIAITNTNICFKKYCQYQYQYFFTNTIFTIY